VNRESRTVIDRLARGRVGEQTAASFLKERGYLLLAKNERTPLGELDLVCRDRAEIVVVEVKARSGGTYGSALEAIGPVKAKRLKEAAVWWLSTKGFFPCALRFDAVVVDLDNKGLPCCLQHIKNVLGA